MKITVTNIETMNKDAPKPQDAPYRKWRRKDRRRRKLDRRGSVRDGIFVSLSHGNDRRRRKDRRKFSS